MSTEKLMTELSGRHLGLAVAVVGFDRMLRIWASGLALEDHGYHLFDQACDYLANEED